MLLSDLPSLKVKLRLTSSVRLSFLSTVAIQWSRQQPVSTSNATFTHTFPVKVQQAVRMHAGTYANLIGASPKKL